MMPTMHKTRHSALLVAVFCGLAGLAPAAHAYLDPSTGSMILSAVVGLFATIGLAVKTYWYKLKNLVTRRPGAPPPTPGRNLPAGQPAGRDGEDVTGQANRPS